MSFISSRPDFLSQLPSDRATTPIDLILPDQETGALYHLHHIRFARTRQTLEVSHLLPSLYLSNLLFHYSLKASIVWGQPGSLQSPECDLLLSALRPLCILFLLPGITSHYLTNPKCSFPFKKLINGQISFLLYYIMLLNVEEISAPKVTV